MDEVWMIVERAIGIADLVEAHDPQNRATALRSLAEIAQAIRESAPDHPALGRLEDYLSAFEA